MNKKSTRKLALSKETLRHLRREALGEVAGALVPSNGPEDYTCRCDTGGNIDGNPDASCVMQCQSYGYPC